MAQETDPYDDRTRQMIKQSRYNYILSIRRRDGVIELTDLVRSMPEASKVTLRRDLAELAESGAIQRTRGGAVRSDAEMLIPVSGRRLEVDDASGDDFDDLDAIILRPIHGRGGDALRRKTVRNDVPFGRKPATAIWGRTIGKRPMISVGIPAARPKIPQRISYWSARLISPTRFPFADMSGRTHNGVQTRTE